MVGHGCNQIEYTNVENMSENAGKPIENERRKKLKFEQLDGSRIN